MSLYRETRESHGSDCECDHCIADRRYEEAMRRHDAALALGLENNRLLAAILEELRKART